MSVLDAVDTWAERRSGRRAERWIRRSETSAGQLVHWRTTPRTRLLVRIHLGSLVLLLLGAGIQVFWYPFLIPWFVVVLVSCVSWTMLRTVINLRDVAPASALDEYESAVIRTWQSTAYGWLMLLALAAGTYMVLLSAFGPDDLTRWIYSGGIFTYVGMMAANALPTVAYATTFGPVPPSNN
ncbi:hypothetical protein [Corynebacterium sp.]|uniref:hypothetical protein n=1 Tax=Corynebacterium sp. TaxID=1720 RepID=UPI003B3A6E44